MAKFYSTDGNLIICDKKPRGGYTVEEWQQMCAPVFPEVTLAAAQAGRMAEIRAGYDAAVAASLTMPTASPTEQDVTIGAAAFAAEDAEGLAYVMQTHAARRDELLAAVDAATTPEAVQAIAVNYAV